MTREEMLSKEMILQHLKCMNYRIRHMNCSGCYTDEKGCPFAKALDARQKDDPFPIDRWTWMNTFEWSIITELLQLRKRLGESAPACSPKNSDFPFDDISELMMKVYSDGRITHQ